MTAEKVPIPWTCGEARVIDVRSLVGSTKPAQWPASPEITAGHVKAFEEANGALNAGDVVIFRTGHNDKALNLSGPAKPGWPAAAAAALWQDPLNGKAEGWPAPGPDAIVYLKSK